MFGGTGFGAAGARYRTIDIASRVEGASPHRLIAVMYEELVASFDAIRAGQRQGARRDLARRAKALSILHALEASLDHERGGEIARGLAKVYREARRLLVKGVEENDPKPIERASAMIGEIAEAWGRIG